MMTNAPGHGPVESWEHKREVLDEMVERFTGMWNERVNAPPRPDLISMLCHGEATRDMDRMEYLGNLILLIVGGNDTTRNTITGSVLALHQNPDQDRKLRENPELIPSMVSETIRWQTPLAYMRRRRRARLRAGRQDHQGGRQDRHVVRLGQPRRRGHRAAQRLHHRPRTGAPAPVSSGSASTAAWANRLAELQLKIIWEEILKRFPTIEVVGEPKRVYSSFVKGYETLPVMIPTRL